jgi:hypothetical protein
MQNQTIFDFFDIHLQINMKPYRLFVIFLIVTGNAGVVGAQTADEIISKYVQSIGGQDVIKKIKSLYLESTSKAMGFKATTITTVLNGKGYKSETQFMGRKIVTCYNDKGGWSSGTNKDKKTMEMSQNQYQTGMDQMFIGTPFLDYKVRGFQAAYLGREKVGDINTHKVSLTKSATGINEYWFDPATGFLIKSSQQTMREGNQVEIVTVYADYYKTKSGFALPLTTEMDFNNKMSVKSKVIKVIVDQPINAIIFVMPD